MGLISIAEAFSLILERTPVAEVQRVSLGGALGCYLAEDVRADRDWPPFHRSAVDGYAVFSTDTRAAPDVLELIEEVAAGTASARVIGPGQTIKIMTGAQLPVGADAVVMRELTEVPREGFVKFKTAAKQGQNIARRASDCKSSDVVIRTGTLIGAAEIGVLAAVGCVSVPVRKLPTAAILGTGDEVVEPHLQPGAVQIRNSNSHQLIAQCAEQRISARYLGIAPDDRDATRKLVEEGLTSELFISTGGVSVGDHDHVGAVFGELNVDILFSKVAIKPGKPTIMGLKNGSLVFGLPGNPVAAWVCFHLFVMTAVRVRCGAAEPLPRWYSLPLLGGDAGPADRTTFKPCNLVVQDGVTMVKPVDWHGSGHLASLVGVDGLFVQQANTALTAGQTVTYYPVR